MIELAEAPLCLDCGHPLEMIYISNSLSKTQWRCAKCKKDFEDVYSDNCRLCMSPMYNHFLDVVFFDRGFIHPTFYCCSNPECELFRVVNYSDKRFGVFWDGMEQVQMLFNNKALTRLEIMIWGYFSTGFSKVFPVKERTAKKHFLNVFRTNVKNVK